MRNVVRYLDVYVLVNFDSEDTQLRCACGSSGHKMSHCGHGTVHLMRESEYLLLMNVNMEIYITAKGLVNKV